MTTIIILRRYCIYRIKDITGKQFTKFTTVNDIFHNIAPDCIKDRFGSRQTYTVSHTHTIKRGLFSGFPFFLPSLCSPFWSTELNLTLAQFRLRRMMKERKLFLTFSLIISKKKFFLLFFH